MREMFWFAAEEMLVLPDVLCVVRLAIGLTYVISTSVELRVA